MKQELEWAFQSQHCQAKQTVFEWVQQVLIGFMQCQKHINLKILHILEKQEIN